MFVPRISIFLNQRSNMTDMKHSSNIYEVVIETPKGSFVKRNEQGNIDLISPFPCPFNYGRVEGYHGKDGDPLDAIILGEKRSYNSRHHLPVIGVVRFIDGGAEDHKWIFSTSVPTSNQERKLRYFFQIYAQIKNLTRLIHVRDCPSRLLCIEWEKQEIVTDSFY